MPRSHPRIDEGELLLVQWREFRKKIFEWLIHVGEDFVAARYTTAQLVDLGFICREFKDECDDTRKETKKIEDLIGKQIAFEWTTAMLQGEDPADPVQGELASGSPGMEMQANLPRRGTKEYLELCKYFNVPDEVAKQGIFDLDWKGLSAHVTERQTLGQNPPPGVGKLYPNYFTTFRRKSRKSREEA